MVIRKRGQQELVGFVLIVILVVVALMIFLVISLKKPIISVESKSTESMLSVVMAFTTDCVVSAPYRETMRELVEGCYKREKCANMDKMACDYLNESLTSIMNDLQQTDLTISSFRIFGYWENEQKTERSDIFMVGKKCINGALRGDTSPIYVNSGQINVVLELCNEQ